MFLLITGIMTENNTASLFCQRHSRLHSPGRINMLKITHVCVGGCCYAQHHKQPHHTRNTDMLSFSWALRWVKRENRSLPLALCAYVTVRHQLSAVKQWSAWNRQDFILWEMLDDNALYHAGVFIIFLCDFWSRHVSVSDLWKDLSGWLSLIGFNTNWKSLCVCV